MIIRIVRMSFRPEETTQFLEIFNRHKTAIRNFPGCTHLELLQDFQAKHVFTTLSHWNDPQDLEAYRNSTLFKSVWEKVKPLFSARTEAVTYQQVI